MVRVATAVLAILLVFSAPIASAMCIDCCEQPLKQRTTKAVCHDNAQAHLAQANSSHVHHMHMAAQKSDAVVQECDRQSLERPLSCQSDVCADAIPAKLTIASAPAHELRISSRLAASATGNSLTITPVIVTSSGPPHICQKGIDSFSSASAPLRI